ncbi:reverse transcriptase domain-containing protein [Halovenus marina]|uniref:RNA-directed DNA polymerase n=1 Tax=Halovenus marina TaxID=3396621 RepID=UPI003F5450C9
MEIDRNLNLSLAWRKTKRDLRHYMNAFADTPYLIDILNSQEDEWLDDLEQRLSEEDESANYGNSSEGEFEPTTPRVIDVPKSNYHLRPAHILYVEDMVVYSALMLELYDEIRDAICWSAANRRFSHILYEDKGENNRWQDFERDYWKEMQECKIILADEYNYVIETDVSGFYENIDIERATSVIRQMTGKKTVAMKLWGLLAMWAEPRKRGVPQGYGPSDIIAEAYLDSIDRRLKNHEVDHVRFNDDYFVFLNSRDRAIETQNLLERLFRSKGLNMKSGKTEIREAQEAKEDFEEPESVFNELRDSNGDNNNNGEEARTPQVTATPYGVVTVSSETDEDSSSDEEGQSESETDDGVSEEMLEEAYNQYIESVDFDELEHHLFRYIINRLGDMDNTIAVDYCMDYIREGRADVRRIIYNYFDDLSSASEIADNLAQDISEGQIRYSYHEFTLIRWFFESNFNSPDILHAARLVLSAEKDSLLEARDYAMAILGEFGDYSDWEQIEMTYDEELRPTSKAVMTYALRNFEPNHRSKLYQRIDTSNQITELSIEAAKSDAEEI